MFLLQLLLQLDILTLCPLILEIMWWWRRVSLLCWWRNMSQNTWLHCTSMAKMWWWISWRQTLWCKEWLWRLICTGPRPWSVVRWRHGHDGWLRGQNHVPQRSALIHYLLDHVTGGHLHWHCDGRRRIGRHHRHSHRSVFSMDGAQLRVCGAELRLLRIIVLVVVILRAIHVIMSFHCLSCDHSLQHGTRTTRGYDTSQAKTSSANKMYKSDNKTENADEDGVFNIDDTAHCAAQSHSALGGTNITYMFRS